MKKQMEKKESSLQKRIFIAGSMAVGVTACIICIGSLGLRVIGKLTVGGWFLVPVVCGALAGGLTAWYAACKLISPLRQARNEKPVYRELRPLTEELNAQKSKLLRQIKESEKQHAAQDAMRRDFTANVSHELKTPLTTVSGYAELIRDGIAAPADIPRFAGKIAEESGRMITLVGDIIRLSRFDEKEVPVVVEELALMDICREILDRLAVNAAKKQVTLSLAGEPVCIHGSREVVSEIIYNILDNAVKYNREGGSVAVTLKQCVDGVQVEVCDTGIGIPQEDLPHIFERFYRVDKSHSKQLGGTGLGLSIVKHAAAFMGAKIDVKSEMGVGTTVRVLF